MRLLKWLEEVISPRGLKCLCCDDRSDGEFLCPTCRKALAAMRITEENAADSIRSVFNYDGVARKLVILLKDHCVADAAQALAKEMAAAVEEMHLPEDTVLTWVSMPDVRRKVRGIDHGRTLCEAVAAQSGRPCGQLLVRHKNSHTQRGLNREARLKNIASSIRCEEKITTPVLLIDDVLTTGATVTACAEALREAGAPQVFALTATRVAVRAGKRKNREVDRYGLFTP